MPTRGRDKHLRETAKQFDDQALRYDRSCTVRRFQSRAQALVLSQLDFRPGMRVLDLGCGTGTATLAIAPQLGESGEVVGVDASPKMIAEAEGKRRRLGLTHVSFDVGYAEELAEQSSFDVVVCTNAFHHFRDKGDIFRRVFGALRPGGRFAIEDICDDASTMRILDRIGRLGERAHVGSTGSMELRQLMEDAGFEQVEVDRVRVTWFWRIMIGQGQRPAISAHLCSERHTLENRIGQTDRRDDGS